MHGNKFSLMHTPVQRVLKILDCSKNLTEASGIREQWAEIKVHVEYAEARRMEKQS